MTPLSLLAATPIVSTTDAVRAIATATAADSAASIASDIATSNAVSAGAAVINANGIAAKSQAAVVTATTSKAAPFTIATLTAQASKDAIAAQAAAQASTRAAAAAQVAAIQAQTTKLEAQAIIAIASSVIEVSQYAVLNQGTPSGKMGFVDPSGKYPLISHNGESDTPRLASGQNLLATIVSEKNEDQTTGIPIANSEVSWNQSPPPYNASYPFNTVHTSESGHVIEIDDTKGSERINIHHMAGTFIEIDGESNLTNKIKGIRTIIVEADDLLYVTGSGHITIDGDMSVRIGGNCQIEVLGNANIAVNGNLTQTVAGDMTVKVGGNYSQEVTGNSTYRVGGDSNNEIIGTGNYKFGLLNQYSIGVANFNSDSMLNLSSKIDFNLSVTGNANLRTIGAFSIDGAILNIEAGMANPPPVSASATVSAIPLQGTIPLYSPTIVTPSPVTKLESYTMETEGPDNTTTRQALLSGETPQGNTPTNVLESVDAGTPTIAPVLTGCDFGTISLNTQLSKNFTLNMLLGDAGRPFPFGIGQHGITDANIVCNLRKLCINVLEPLRDKYSALGFKINSGYRNAGRLPKSGKNVSQHELGQAADISFTTIRGQKDQVTQFFNIAKEINAMGLPIDQLIFETDPIKGYVWIHVSYNEQAKLPRADGTGVMSYYGNGYIHKLELHV